MIRGILIVLVVGLILVSGYLVSKLQRVMKKKSSSSSEFKRNILNSGYSNLALLIATLALFGVTCFESREIFITILSGIFFIADLITIYFQIKLIIEVKNLGV